METVRTQTRQDWDSFAPAVAMRAGEKRSGQAYGKASRRIDAGLYLQATCKLVQTANADCEAMECFVQDEGVGLVCEDICRMLALVLCDLIGGAAACLGSNAIEPQLRIWLRRRGKTILFAVESRWLTESGACAPSGIHDTQQMIAALGTSCMLRLMPERNLIAIMLNESKAEPRIANAIAAYRLARVGHRPFAPESMEQAYHA